VEVASGRVAGAAQLPVALHAMDAVTIADGRVLATGGQVEGGNGTDRAWVYDPGSDSWSETGRMAERRFKHFSVLLPDGRVLVIGGTTDDDEILATTEIYDPALGSFTPGPDLIEPRYKLPGGAVLIDGDRVIVGGGGRTIEIIDIAQGTSSVLEDLGSQGSFATTTRLGDGNVLILGGYDRNIRLRRIVRVIAGA
jgi:Kelch motif